MLWLVGVKRSEAYTEHVITASGPDMTFSVPQSFYKVAVYLHLMGVVVGS